MPARRCSSCDRRKGKRACPALGGVICPRCCGSKRIVEIRCPPTCRHLQHERYQGERFFDPGHPWFQRYARTHDEGADRFSALLFLDTSIAAYFRRNPDMTLAQLLRALEHLRNQVGPLEVPGGIVTDLETHLGDGMERWLEKAQIGSQALQETIEETRAFFEREVGSDGALRDYVRFASAFTNPEAEPPEEASSPEGGGGLIVKPG
jgi:hypothetical protein